MYLLQKSSALKTGIEVLNKIMQSRKMGTEVVD